MDFFVVFFSFCVACVQKEGDDSLDWVKLLLLDVGFSAGFRLTELCGELSTAALSKLWL